MCNVSDTFVDQAIDWLWDDLWKMLEYDHNEFRILMTVDDLVHLDNTMRGRIGYNPDIVADFPIGL